MKEAAQQFELLQTKTNSKHPKLDGWHYIKDVAKRLPPIIGSNIEAFRLGIGVAHNEGLVLEFGVRFGTSIRQIAEIAKQEVHGFASFQGLPDAWNSLPPGTYSTNN